MRQKIMNRLWFVVSLAGVVVNLKLSIEDLYYHHYFVFILHAFCTIIPACFGAVAFNNEVIFYKEKKNDRI